MHAPRVIGVSTVFLIGLAACTNGTGDQTLESSPAPIYYVDGARPLPGAEHSPNQEGCVPWSEDRPDFLLCAPVSDGWRPPAPPGDYADYPDVCDEAARVFGEQVKDLAFLYELSVRPRVDVGTCGAAGLSRGRWLVRLGLANAEDVRPYKSASFMSLSIGGRGPEYATLSKDPWPLE